MAAVTTDENIVITRDYTDNFSIKDTAMNTLGKKYFEDVELSGLNVGELGFVLEQMANMTEDAFNTASLLINEAFPNKARIPESIYSHAAIFQLDNSFSKCASCTFAMMLPENEVLEYSVSNGIKLSFYIDKRTVINVEGIPFTLDYDIEISAQKKQINGAEYTYNYSAKYILDSNNSISDINDPYIKIRKLPNNYLLLIVEAHQVERTELTDNIINNTKINYPILEFEFDGKLCGFDIFYKSPTDKEFTQLTKLIKFSLPKKIPFCYYKLKDNNVLEISFSTRDGYFVPEFNSEIKIVMYTTLGKNGEFPIYNGSTIELEMMNEKYEYNDAITIAFKAMSASSGANDGLSLEGLQALTVESYSSANEISDENDIMTYFYNYKYRYGSEILVIKRRDDITERLFSSFLIMKNDDYIYPTNTLTLDIIEDDFDTYGDSRFTLNPGHVFIYQEGSNKIKIVPGIMAYETDKLNEFMKDNLFVYTNPFLISMTKSPNLIGIYKNIVNQVSILDFISSNDDSFTQFITSKITLTRGLEKDSKYRLSLNIVPSSSLDQYVTNLNTYEGNDVRIIIGFVGTDGTEVGYIELYPTKILENDNASVEFSRELETNDYITSNNLFPIINAIKVNEKAEYMYIPISNVTLNVYILYDDALTETNRFSEYFDGMEYFVLTNIYNTQSDKITFIEPMNMMRSNVIFKNIGTDIDPIINANISLLPMIKADIINNEDNFNSFISSLTSIYTYMENCLPLLRNNTNIDIKFYNTYGKSNNYYIGDNNELIDRVNINIKFKVTLYEGVDEIDARNALVDFIKNFIENIGSDGFNSLYISNLITKIETNFAYVKHLRFMGINDYSTEYQTISLTETDLDKLSKDERRKYVPEVLVIDKNNISLSISTN